MVVSAFQQYENKAYPYFFKGTIHVYTLVGGTPSDPKVVDGWLRKKLGTTDERLLMRQVAETLAERVGTVDAKDMDKLRDEVLKEIQDMRTLNGFKRHDERGLYIEGRQLKAAIKEMANIRWPYPHKWGRYENSKGNTVGGKASKDYFAEHVIVEERRLYLRDAETQKPITEPTGVIQGFVHTDRITAIKYEEYCDDVEFDFTVKTDFEMDDQKWGLMWLTGEQQGIGASRSQSYGKYVVSRWERIR